jgi:hypothetical protein
MVSVPGAGVATSIEGTSHSYFSSRSCASVRLMASEVRPQFVQKCSCVAGSHLTTECLMRVASSLRIRQASIRIKPLVSRASEYTIQAARTSRFSARLTELLCRHSMTAPRRCEASTERTLRLSDWAVDAGTFERIDKITSDWSSDRL